MKHLLATVVALSLGACSTTGFTTKINNVDIGEKEILITAGLIAGGVIVYELAQEKTDEDKPDPLCLRFEQGPIGGPPIVHCGP